MTGPDDRRDDELAEVLARIAVPDYEPGFWERLESLLAGQPVPEASPADDERDRSGPGDGEPIRFGPPADDERDRDLAVVPLAGRRRPSTVRTRATLVLAAAAAVVVAVLAVRLSADDGPDDVELADRPGTSTTVPLSSLAGERARGVLGPAGSTATPQDAFVTWITALDAGDLVTAEALVGPMTLRYWEALGTDVEGSGTTWARWVDSADRRLDVIDFGQVEGRRVAGLLIEGTADPDFEGYEEVDGLDHDALVLVEGDAGWLVEPAAFDPDAESRLEPVHPAPGEQGLQPIGPDDDVRIAVQGAGVYYVGVDEGRMGGFVPADARDGLLTYEPDGPLEPGRHLLVIAHLSPKVLILDALPFTVTEPTRSLG